MYPFPPLGACVRDGLASQFHIGGENETGLPEIIICSQNYIVQYDGLFGVEYAVLRALYRQL